VDQAHKAFGVRFLAALLGVGGLFGIGLGLYMGYQYLQQHWVFIFLVAAFVAVFAWSTLTGARLWRGDARGWKWAIILLIAQIPVLTVPGFSYEFYTGLAIKLLGGNVQNNFAMGFGTSINVYLDVRINDLIYGVNLFAFGAAIYLLYKKPNSVLQLRRRAPVTAV